MQWRESLHRHCIQAAGTCRERPKTTTPRAAYMRTQTHPPPGQRQSPDAREAYARACSGVVHGGSSWVGTACCDVHAPGACAVAALLALTRIGMNRSRCGGSSSSSIGGQAAGLRFCGVLLVEAAASGVLPGSWVESEPVPLELAIAVGCGGRVAGISREKGGGQGTHCQGLLSVLVGKGVSQSGRLTHVTRTPLR